MDLLMCLDFLIHSLRPDAEVLLQPSYVTSLCKSPNSKFVMQICSHVIGCLELRYCYGSKLAVTIGETSAWLKQQ